MYRDERYVAVDKPGQLLVHRSGAASDRTALLQLVRGQLGSFLFPVHRLDRAASGVVLFALDREAAAAAQRALHDPETDKRYLALVRGCTEAAFESRRPLHSENGKVQEAWTEFRRLAALEHGTLLDVRLHSGRRHQIRRHLAHLAHQIIGDTRYGKGGINRALREEYGLPRMFLHARRLALAHPLSGEPLCIESPLASDLRGFLERLPGVSRDLLSSL